MSGKTALWGARRAIAMVVNLVLVLTSLVFGLVVLLWAFQATDSRVLGIASGIVGAFVVDGIAARLILPLAYTRPSFAVVALLAWIVGLRFAIAAFLALPTWAIIVAFFVVAFGYTARWPAKSK
jgi:hypothetical protein